jgi:hypothetical protein
VWSGGDNRQQSNGVGDQQSHVAGTYFLRCVASEVVRQSDPHGCMGVSGAMQRIKPDEAERAKADCHKQIRRFNDVGWSRCPHL